MKRLNRRYCVHCSRRLQAKEKRREIGLCDVCHSNPKLVQKYKYDPEENLADMTLEELEKMIQERYPTMPQRQAGEE